MLINHHDAWHCLKQKIQVFFTFLVQGLRNWECWPDYGQGDRLTLVMNMLTPMLACCLLPSNSLSQCHFDCLGLLPSFVSQLCAAGIFFCKRAWSISLFLQLVDSHQDWINWEQMDKSSLCQRHEEEKILFCRQTLQKIFIVWYQISLSLVQMHPWLFKI